MNFDLDDFFLEAEKNGTLYGFIYNIDPIDELPFADGDFIVVSYSLERVIHAGDPELEDYSLYISDVHALKD